MRSLDLRFWETSILGRYHLGRQEPLGPPSVLKIPKDLTRPPGSATKENEGQKRRPELSMETTAFPEQVGNLQKREDAVPVCGIGAIIYKSIPLWLTCGLAPQDRVLLGSLQLVLQTPNPICEIKNIDLTRCMPQRQAGTEDKVNSADQEQPSVSEMWIAEQWGLVLMADGKVRWPSLKQMGAGAVPSSAVTTQKAFPSPSLSSLIQGISL